MAALHLATLPNEEKLKVVEARAKSDRFDMVWRFMFGLASKHNTSCSDNVFSLEDNLMDKFLVVKKFSLCPMAFEASDPSFAVRVSIIFGKDLLNSDYYTPFDCMARFYILRYTEKCNNMVIRNK